MEQNEKAFPGKQAFDSGHALLDDQIIYHQGMDLIDYFAVKILSAQLLDKSTHNWHNITRAENAYRLADAMITVRKERKKPESEEVKS